MEAPRYDYKSTPKPAAYVFTIVVWHFEPTRRCQEEGCSGGEIWLSRVACYSKIPSKINWRWLVVGTNFLLAFYQHEPCNSQSSPVFNLWNLLRPLVRAVLTAFLFTFFFHLKPPFHIFTEPFVIPALAFSFRPSLCFESSPLVRAPFCVVSGCWTTRPIRPVDRQAMEIFTVQRFNHLIISLYFRPRLGSGAKRSYIVHEAVQDASFRNKTSLRTP